MLSSEPKIPGISLNNVVPTPEPALLTGVPIFFGCASLKPATNQSQDEWKKLTLATDFDKYLQQDTKQAQGYLRDVIQGFFANGGLLCYVITLKDNTLETLQKALEVSEVLEDVDLVCVPDIMQLSDKEVMQRQQAVLEYCEWMGDRFAILDAVNNIDKLDAQLEALSSRNGALYAPWLTIETRSTDIPPCGHIAGIYANSDRTVGVYGAPANITLAGVLDLSFSQNPINNQSRINYIRSFPGRGMRVWGVRTLSPIPEWQYINVRRLFLTFGRWANRNLATTVFEPNAFPLWVRLQRELSVYCESLWRQGALQGALPQEAFYVKCDAETNPPENREIGQVVAEVGLAPTVPGEFIQVLIVQNTSGITLI